MITQERLKEILVYDELSGVFTARVDRNKIKSGDVLGFISNQGYVIIGLDHKRYLAHRLAWLYVHGEFPTIGIDHIDRVRDHNWISNLRIATQSQNLTNILMFSHNKSGYKGVHYHKQSGKWRAMISVGNKSKHLGLFDTPQEASEAYTSYAVLTNGTFVPNQSNLN